jgi:hypothetical protein
LIKLSVDVTNKPHLPDSLRLEFQQDDPGAAKARHGRFGRPPEMRRVKIHAMP